jgi:2-(1,2-epoxy-1,2-dihydrophenyl)acetyl-CoA isomerase
MAGHTERENREDGDDGGSQPACLMRMCKRGAHGARFWHEASSRATDCEHRADDMPLTHPAGILDGPRYARGWTPLQAVAFPTGGLMSDLVILSEADGVATLLLNRPEKLNAFTIEMAEAFGAAIATVARRSDLRVLVVTGAGRAFSAGGDVAFMTGLKEADAAYEGLAPLVEIGGRAIAAMAALPIPTIACVNGVAAGGSCNLALACDLRIASDQARFGESFVRIGLHADWSGTYFLPRLAGTAKALELCWLGDMIDATEALRIGLLNRVVPHDRLEAETRALARRLADAPQTSIRNAKRALYASAHRTLAECLAAETAAQAECWASPDSAEGVRAFSGKRSPVFGAALSAGGVAPSAAARRFE